jgi:hypothetical protein
MPAAVWIVIAIAVLVVIGLGIYFAIGRGRTRSLRSRFGSEYDRTVRATGDQHKAERELDARQERRRQFDIRELEPAVQSQYVEQWLVVQARFVDEPAQALRDADGMVTEIMGKRGYPMHDFEQMAADVSVDHAPEVEDYRAAHAISEASTRDEASTEDMRRGIQHYRSLFESLLGQEITIPASGAVAGINDHRDEPIARAESR